MSEKITAQSKKNTSFNHVWWLPLIALLIVSYLAISHYTSQGPLITVQFANAEGLEVDKTKVRYKDVVIGKVEKIDLGDDYKNVTVSVRMDKKSEGLLRQNSQFWVVKPRIGITQISGLNTLLSGNYITIDPDKNTESDYRYQFIGLEMPPIITQDKPGLRLTLLADKAASLYPGTSVYFKGMQVGTVNRVYFSSDYLWVKADIFLESPHDQLIKQNTKFWTASGVSIDAGAEGLDIEMESMEALIAGGIAFETPVSLTKEYPVDSGTEYILYNNKKLAFEQNHGRKHYYVTYFDSSVKGLETDAPVMVQGINVGKVKDIQLLFDEASGKTHIPVLFEIYESRLGLVKTNASEQHITEKLIKQGLRTRLETGNLLTGSKFIGLTMTDEVMGEQEQLATDELTGYPILPSVPESFDAITSGVSSLISKVNQLPLNDIANNINQLLTSADGKINELQIQQTLNMLNQLMGEGKQVLAKDVRSALHSLNRSIEEMAKSAESTLSSADKTLAGYSPDAPLYYHLSETLETLNETLNSFKAVTEMLERSPDALIFGEPKIITNDNQRKSANQKRTRKKREYGDK